MRFPPITAIVPAAGAGRRAQCAAYDLPKQYREIKGEPMLRLAVRALLADARITQVRVAVTPQDSRAQAALAGLPRTLWRPCGGATRAHTVLAALRDAALAEDAWVLVHDAARPGLPVSALARLLDACLTQGCGGLLALPVRDTVKRAADIANPSNPSESVAVGQLAARVVATVPREDLWLAQTPQLFLAGPLQRALQAALDAGSEPSDEACAMEMRGEAPLLIPGSPRNAKVTWPEDFAWMQAWL